MLELFADFGEGWTILKGFTFFLLFIGIMLMIGTGRNNNLHFSIFTGHFDKLEYISMVRMKAAVHIILGSIFIFLTSCYEEITIPQQASEGIFNFQLTPEQEEEIITARQVSWMVENPKPDLYRGDEVFTLDRFEIRGESSLNYRRKSYSINMDTDFFLYVDREDRVRNIEEYKLISLVFDYTYIEGAIATGIFLHLGLWPTHSEYTEVQLNNHTQGLYLFIEDPVEYFLYQQDASFVLRRYYHHSLKNFHINEQRNTLPETHYIARFDSIYSYITQFQGSQLYDSLNAIVDMQEYFEKMAVDMLLQNGDYTDEIFFYTKIVDGKEIFGIYPWDYDDLFREIPHEVGRAWSVGTVFGTRVYNSMDDILADVGERLIFSIEDDLDYIIAKDEFLYQRYLEVLGDVMTIISDAVINSVFQDAKEQLQPFYDDEEIIAQSQYDVNPTNQELFDQNLAEKRQFLIDRRHWIIQKIPEHKN